jgi:excisionase family DNA binding protein
MILPNGGGLMGNRTEYIGTSEAAKLLKITSRRVVGLCTEGKISGAFRSGRNWKIPVTSVEQYMEEIGMALPGELTHASGELLPFAIGNTSYIEISSECYYVDKTLLIRDLIDDHNMVTLFTRPRRFGKTLAINMIKTFFEKTEDNTAKYFIDKKISKKDRLSYPIVLNNRQEVILVPGIGCDCNHYSNKHNLFVLK